jgi:ribokinase
MDLVAIAPRIPVVGETIIGDKYFTEPGGKGANQAYGAARLGGHVAMLGRIGDDEFGQSMRNNLANAGCDVAGIHVEAGASGVALIFVSATGQNSIIVVPGANMKFSPEHVALDREYILEAKVVLLQLENPMPTVIAAAQAARRAGALVVLDPAPAPASPLPAELLQNVDIVTPNETEGAILAGLPPGRLEPDQAARLGRGLQGKGPKTVIMKLGDQGCVVVEQGTPVLLPAPEVNAVDTTAAGDVFNAGLAVGISEGLDIQSACRFANQAASLSVTRLGAQVAVPTRKEVDQFAATVKANGMTVLAE